MNFIKCILIIVFGSLWLPNTLFAQNAFEGTQFVAPLYYYEAHWLDKLELISATNNCVRIQIPTSKVDTSFSVVANTSTLFDLDDVGGFVYPDSTAHFNNLDSLIAQHFKLTSAYPISVSRFFKDHYFRENITTLNLLPSCEKQRYTITDCITEEYSLASYLFVTIVNYDSLKIEVNDSNSYYRNGTSNPVTNIDISLNTGASLRIASLTAGYNINEDGYSGYSFSSKSPISLVGIGLRNVKKSCKNGSENFKSVPYTVFKPNSLAGHYYFVTPMATYNNYYNLVALEDSTDIFIDGSYAATINATESLDSCLATTGAVVSSNKPIQLAQFVQNRLSSETFETHGVGVQAADTAEFIHRSIFTTYWPEAFDSTFNNLNIITKTADTAQLAFNGAPLSNPGWQLFAADVNYAWCRIRVPSGTYEVQSPSGFHGLYFPHATNSVGKILAAAANFLPGLSSGQQIEDSSAFYYQKPNLPKTKFEESPVKFCGNGTLNFYHNMARHTTWYWQFGDGTDTLIKVENEKPKPFAHTFAQPGQYWVTVQDSAGCAQGDSLLVEVLPNPTAAFSATSTASCTGTFVQLQNQSTGAQEYFWQWPNGSSTAQNPNFQYAGNESEIEITLIAKSENCTDTMRQTFNIESLAFNPRSVPNIITPNNDGRNDAFCIPDVAGFAECFDLQIFNRWGQAVFSTQNPQDCWRGQFQNQPTADGVYFYVLQLAGQTYQGEVTVMGGE